MKIDSILEVLIELPVDLQHDLLLRLRDGKTDEVLAIVDKLPKEFKNRLKIILREEKIKEIKDKLRQRGFTYSYSHPTSEVWMDTNSNVYCEWSYLDETFRLGFVTRDMLRMDTGEMAPITGDAPWGHQYPKIRHYADLCYSNGWMK